MNMNIDTMKLEIDTGAPSTPRTPSQRTPRQSTTPMRSRLRMPEFRNMLVPSAQVLSTISLSMNCVSFGWSLWHVLLLEVGNEIVAFVTMLGLSLAACYSIIHVSCKCDHDNYKWGLIAAGILSACMDILGWNTLDSFAMMLDHSSPGQQQQQEDATPLSSSSSSTDGNGEEEQLNMNDTLKIYIKISFLLASIWLAITAGLYISCVRKNDTIERAVDSIRARRYGKDMHV